MYMTVANPTKLHRCFFGTEYAELQFCTVLLLHGYCLVIKGKLKPQWWLCLVGLVTCPLRLALALKPECREVNYIVGKTWNPLYITLCSSRNKNMAYATLTALIASLYSSNANDSLPNAQLWTLNTIFELTWPVSLSSYLGNIPGLGYLAQNSHHAGNSMTGSSTFLNSCSL